MRKNQRHRREVRYVAAVQRQLALQAKAVREGRPYRYADPSEFLRRGDHIEQFRPHVND